MTEADRLRWYMVAEGISWTEAMHLIRTIEEDFDLVRSITSDK